MHKWHKFLKRTAQLGYSPIS